MGRDILCVRPGVPGEAGGCYSGAKTHDAKEETMMAVTAEWRCSTHEYLADKDKRHCRAVPSWSDKEPCVIKAVLVIPAVPCPRSSCRDGWLVGERVPTLTPCPTCINGVVPEHGRIIERDGAMVTEPGMLVTLLEDRR